MIPSEDKLAVISHSTYCSEGVAYLVSDSVFLFLIRGLLVSDSRILVSDSRVLVSDSRFVHAETFEQKTARSSKHSGRRCTTESVYPYPFDV